MQALKGNVTWKRVVAEALAARGDDTRALTLIKRTSTISLRRATCPPNK